MAMIEFLGFCVSVFGMYGVVICIRFLLPCFITPTVSSMLDNAEQSLADAVATGAIPEVNDHRVDLEILTSRFARMRIESHRSPGFFPQLWLAVRHGLTCKLYSLASQVEAVRQKVEVAVDERRLALLASPQIVVRAATPVPAGNVAMPIPELAPPEPLFLVH